jgi:hypothetical protein
MIRATVPLPLLAVRDDPHGRRSALAFVCVSAQIPSSSRHKASGLSQPAMRGVRLCLAIHLIIQPAFDFFKRSGGEEVGEGSVCGSEAGNCPFRTASILEAFAFIIASTLARWSA